MDRKQLTILKVSLTSVLILASIFVGYKKGAFAKYNYYAYLPNAGDGTVSVIDTETNEVIKKIDIGAAASDGIAVSKDGRFLYAGNAQDGDVLVVDTSTGEKIKEIKTGLNVHGIDITPDGKYVYVTSGDLKDGVQYNYVSIINTNNNEVVGQITSDWKSPSHIDFSRNGEFAFISNVVSNEVAIVDTKSQKIIKRIPVGNIPNETEPSQDGKRLYVANVGDGTLSVINLVNYKTLNVIKTGKGTHGVAVSTDDRYVWTANRTSNDVTVIEVSSGKVIKSIEVGGTPNHISVIPNSNVAYVSNKDSGDIAVIDMEKYEIIKRIPIGKEPHEIDLVALKKQNGE